MGSMLKIEATRLELTVPPVPRIKLDLAAYSDFLTGKSPPPPTGDRQAWAEINACSDVAEAITAAVDYDRIPRWNLYARFQAALKAMQAMRRIVYYADASDSNFKR